MCRHRAVRVGSIGYGTSYGVVLTCVECAFGLYVSILVQPVNKICTFKYPQISRRAPRRKFATYKHNTVKNAFRRPVLYIRAMLPGLMHRLIFRYSASMGIMIFFTVLCFWLVYFLRGARPEICGYFNVQIRSNFGVRIGTYRANAHHTRVSTEPDEVPYPIERTRSVLCRHTIGFHIGLREPDVKVTW